MEGNLTGSSIAKKLVKAMAAIDAVTKGGRNQKFGYDYVRATDVANEVRKALHEAGVAFTYQVLTERFWDTPTSSGGTQYCCSLHIQGTFTDNDSGECLSSSAIGWGADTQDKAPYKAMTGALKYLLRTTFLIPDELDPENESKEAEVRAEVEKQKKTRQVPEVPPDLEWSWNKASGVLICRIVDVKEAETKTSQKTPYLAIQVNNELDKGKKPLLYYWHATHRKELLAAKGKIVKLLILSGEKGFKVDAVMEINGVKPQLPEESLETQARLLASTLDMTEQDLQWVVKSHKGDWPSVLEWLKEKKAQKEQEVTA
jgi:hypothetical protein